MKKRLFFTFGSLLFLSTISMAQTITVQQSSDSVRAKYREKMTDFTGKSSIISQLSFINLTTSTGETDIIGNIGFSYKRNHIFNIQLNTPFNGKTNSEIVNVDGLAKSSSISFGYQFNFKGNMNVKIKSSELNDAFEKIWKERKPDCCGEDIDTIQKYTDLTSDERIELERILTYTKWLPFIGIKAKTGRKSYDFFTDTTLSATSSKDVYEYEGRFILGSQITNHSSFAASVIMQQYYDAGDAALFNRTTNANTLVSKQEELFLTSPELKTKINIQIEYRGLMKQGKYALQPIIAADLNNKILDARLQFYFLNLKEEDKFKGLNGGMFIGYRTGKDFATGVKKDNILVGIFFSPSFNINKY